MKVSVIGLGRFGKNYVKTLQELNQDIEWVCARTKETLDKFNIKGTLDYKEAFRDVKAVFIVTPANTHYQIVKDALEAKKHVLCEKPLALKTEEVEELNNLAKQNNLILMTGYIHMFNPVIIKLKQILVQLGKINYVQLIQTGKGPIRSDSNVIWDINSHTISILNYLFESEIKLINAQKESYVKEGIEDVAVLNMKIKDIFATSFVSWIHPLKQNKVIISGEKYAVFDNYADDKLKIVDKENNVGIIEYEKSQSLTNEIKYFLEACKTGKLEINTGEDAIKITKILELASS